MKKIKYLLLVLLVNSPLVAGATPYPLGTSFFNDVSNYSNMNSLQLSTIEKCIVDPANSSVELKNKCFLDGYVVGPKVSASLTINGMTDIVVNVGDVVNMAWDSNNADGGSSVFYTGDAITGVRTSCGGGPWTAHDRKNSVSAPILASQAGCTYAINYTATNSKTGQSATATFTAVVNKTRGVTTMQKLKLYDVNGDGKLSFGDLSVLSNYAGASPASTTASLLSKYDMNGDGAVNLSDMSVLRTRIGNNQYDFNEDGKIDITDFSNVMFQVRNAINSTSPTYSSISDLNSDGKVDLKDLDIISSKVGLNTTPISVNQPVAIGMVLPEVAEAPAPKEQSYLASVGEAFSNFFTALGNVWK